jgi:hypothetical protein
MIDHRSKISGKEGKRTLRAEYILTEWEKKRGGDCFSASWRIAMTDDAVFFLAGKSCTC